MLKKFLELLEQEGFLIEDEGYMFDLYYIVLNDRVIELSKKFFPNFKTEKEAVNENISKTIVEFEYLIKEFVFEHYITNRGDL